MVEFNKEMFVAMVKDEDKAAYLVKCFGDDQVAKDAAVKDCV